MTALSPHGVACLILTALVFAVFVRDRWPIATVSLGILALLPLGFAIFPFQVDGRALDPLHFFAGFGNPALFAICSLMIVGHGLVVTGALEPVARRLARVVAHHARSALLAVLVLAMASSGFINDTPVVVLLIPLLLSAARQAKASAAGMLLPMNYAVLIGGMATTIGTSTNLIVVAIAASMGLRPFSLFSYFVLVAMAALPALAYLWLLAPKLLSRVETPVQHLSDDVFDAVLHVGADSKLVGQPLHAALTEAGSGLQVVDLRRGGVSLTRLPSLRLRAEDRIVLRDTAARLKEIESHMDLKLHRIDEGRKGDHEGTEADTDNEADTDADADADTKATPPTQVVAQLIVSPTSPLVGRSARSLGLADRLNVIVVGLRQVRPTSARGAADLHERLLAAGDVLLLQGQPDAMRSAQRQGLGLLLDERLIPPRQEVRWRWQRWRRWWFWRRPSIADRAGRTGRRAVLWPRARSAGRGAVTVDQGDPAGGGQPGAGRRAADHRRHGLLAQASRRASAACHRPAAALLRLDGAGDQLVSNNAAAAIGTPLGISLAAALGCRPTFVLPCCSVATCVT
jgi:Trk K+ transport system NAD-binding subunit